MNGSNDLPVRTGSGSDGNRGRQGGDVTTRTLLVAIQPSVMLVCGITVRGNALLVSMLLVTRGHRHSHVTVDHRLLMARQSLATMRQRHEGRSEALQRQQQGEQKK
jgi:hypothetical protein